MRACCQASTLLAFMLYQGQLLEYFNNLVNSFTGLIRSAGAGAKVFELLARQPVLRGAGRRSAGLSPPPAQSSGLVPAAKAEG